MSNMYQLKQLYFEGLSFEEQQVLIGNIYESAYQLILAVFADHYNGGYIYHNIAKFKDSHKLMAYINEAWESTSYTDPFSIAKEALSILNKELNDDYLKVNETIDKMTPCDHIDFNQWPDNIIVGKPVLCKDCLNIKDIIE